MRKVRGDIKDPKLAREVEFSTYEEAMWWLCGERLECIPFVSKEKEEN